MNNFFLPIIILILFAILNCNTNLIITSQFIDNKTFIVVARGLPNNTVKSSLQKRYTAKRAALLVAQNEVQKKLKKIQIKEASIIKEKYTKNDTCILTYKVNLK